MIYINEWLPNPTGNDAAGEFIELYNNGSGAVNLGGYSLSDGAKKQFSLAGYSIPANGYVVFNKVQSKLSLKNTSGGLWLYGPNGQLVDRASFVGAAPEGKSYSRVDYGTELIGHFAFLYPTPGTKNNTYDSSVAVQHYQFGVSLVPTVSAFNFFLMMVGVAATLLTFSIYVIRKNRNVSNFFFGRNEEARP